MGNILLGHANQVTLDNPMQFKGDINAASDFPTSAEVENGWFYTISTDVTDNDASKTNTGQSFIVGDEIAWNGTDWTLMGNIAHNLDDLADVTITSVADNELLVYDNSSSKWINQTPTEAGLDSVYLKLDGSNANSNIDIGAYGFTADTGTFGQIIDNGLTASKIVETDGSKQLVSSSYISTDLLPGGVDGDLQINNSGLLGTIDGMTLDKTGNARGSGALDIQSSRDAVTEVASGADSVTVGNTNTASVGYENIAIGVGNTSSGSYYGAGQSSAIGYGNSVSGDYTGYSSAIGYENTITGSSSNSSAIGYQNTASDYNSSAFGYLNTASGRDSSAFGYNNTASGQTSSAFGNLNTSVGQESAVFGYQSATDGYRSYAFGYRNVAAGDYSFALGVEQMSFADSNILVGNASAFFNINSVGFSVNNMNALVGFHATSDLLVTDIESLGAEKVTNGTFTGSATGWTLGTGWSYGSNNVKKLIDGTGTLSQDVSAVAGEYYLLTFDYNTFQIGTLDVSLGGQSVEQLNGGGIGIIGTYKAVIKATTTGSLIFTPSNDCRITGGLDNVSVKKITGGDLLLPEGGIITVGDLPITCGTEKTIVLTEPVYKDTNMAGYLLAKPASNFPTVDSFVDENGDDTTIETYAFAIGKKVHGGFELQHDYKEGTDLVFHVHWQGILAPSGTDNVQWRLKYIVMRGGTTLNAAVEIDSPDSPITNQYSTEKADFVAITGTNFKVEDQFMFTLTRVAATGDVYLGDALIATAGIHYQVDTLGSRQIGAK